MDGFFYEMGPLHVNDKDFTVVEHNQVRARQLVPIVMVPVFLFVFCS